MHAERPAALALPNRVRAAITSVLSFVSTPRAALDAAAADARGIAQAVADAGVARWAKLLASRSREGAAPTSLSALRRVLCASDVLASVLEAHALRPGPALRSALQGTCKAALDQMHSATLSRLTGACASCGVAWIVLI